jgi:cytochrome c-type protein NapC
MKGGYVKKEKTSSMFAITTITIVIGIVIGLLIALASAIMIRKTSGKEFCGKCHTMKPMVQAYEHSVHGGANSKGIVVACVECHLPHDSTIHYLITKAKTGSHDIYAESFYNLKKIDWKDKRKERESYVYDSACLACHSNLKSATTSNMKAFLGHRAYFSGKTNKTCVSCHPHVGHKDLGDYLGSNK